MTQLSCLRFLLKTREKLCIWKMIKKNAGGDLTELCPQICLLRPSLTKYLEEIK